MTFESEIPIEERHHTLLERGTIGFLTTIRFKDQLPSTNPVGYIWDGVRIRISSLKSRMKYRNLAADPRIAFCVVDARDVTTYIELRGWATLSDDPERKVFREQFLRATGTEPPADIDSPAAERAVITLHPFQVSSPILYGGRFSELK